MNAATPGWQSFFILEHKASMVLHVKNGTQQTRNTPLGRRIIRLVLQKAGKNEASREPEILLLYFYRGFDFQEVQKLRIYRDRHK